MYICDNITGGPGGELYFAGVSVRTLAEKYGTPLYLMDEDRIRENIRMYRDAVREHFGSGSGVLYAGKAACFRHIYRIMADEGAGIDVVSAGEAATALGAGYDLAGAFFHGNAKTDEEIAFALEKGVGYFVCDCEEELCALEKAAGERGMKQKILLRITPGIDPHTYDQVATGKVDSKFGSAVATGRAEEMTRLALGMPHLSLKGYHCHVGSQVFTEDVFERSAEIMLRFMADMRDKLGFTAEVLDLGGGFGVRYVKEDPVPDIPGRIASLARTVKECCGELSLEVPRVFLEPGRSIVADAGMTVYTVMSVKRIPGYRTYVAVDGGMGDNPRYALYGSKYTCLSAEASGSGSMMKCDLVGRYCESGDILARDIVLSGDIKRGDIIAVYTTGAYNYSMASDYNRVPRPPVVMLKGKESFVAVRRESFDDLMRLDV